MAWLFLTQEEVQRIHAIIIAVFGGSDGIRDEGALSSALAPVENRRHYENADLAVCVATFAYHLTKAHAFVDGNKRIGAAVSEVFLEINEAHLSASNENKSLPCSSGCCGQYLTEAVEEFFARSLRLKHDQTDPE